MNDIACERYLVSAAGARGEEARARGEGLYNAPIDTGGGSLGREHNSFPPFFPANYTSEFNPFYFIAALVSPINYE